MIQKNVPARIQKHSILCQRNSSDDQKMNHLAICDRAYTKKGGKQISHFSNRVSLPDRVKQYHITSKPSNSKRKKDREGWDPNNQVIRSF